MMHYLPTEQDILGSLPPAERDELLRLLEETPDLHWLAVAPAVWDAFTAAVNGGDRR
jgi:hypothetical protein